MRDAKNKLTVAVWASGTTLTEVFGVGPIVTATVIGEARAVSRFASRDHFAAYNGTAPIEVSSGRRKIYRLSRRGNRRLNHAIHMAAVTQISHRHSPGRAYYERNWPKARPRKRPCAPSSAASATSSSPASRPTAAEPRAHGEEPARVRGERLCRQRGRLTPQAPALRLSHSRTSSTLRPAAAARARRPGTN
jgi:Transposase IS116/IS110/IS902 family